MSSGVDRQQCELEDVQEVEVEGFERVFVAVDRQLFDVLEENDETAVERLSCNVRNVSPTRFHVEHVIVFVVSGLQKETNFTE